MFLKLIARSREYFQDGNAPAQLRHLFWFTVQLSEGLLNSERGCAISV